MPCIWWQKSFHYFLSLILLDATTHPTIMSYCGSITSENLSREKLSVPSRIPLHLFKKLLDNVGCAKGYHMYTDGYYSSISMANELLKMECHLTGTLSTNSKGVPPRMKKPKLSKANIGAGRKNNTFMEGQEDCNSS